ncbi:MAG: ABC transporter ATP-binding protein, partial [Chloroflexi bacterium]|nr:ABC transporter ATP-binding protein [Chloroflexota bacterium]
GDSAVIYGGALSLMGLTLIRGVLTFLSGRWTEVSSRNVARDLRDDLYSKLQSLSFSYHDQTETGDLLARAITDIDRVRFLTGRAFLRLVEVVTLVIGIAALMLSMHIPLALLTLATTPFLAIVAFRFGRRYRPLSLVINQQISTLTSRLEQNLRGARVIKAFAQEAAEIDRFDSDNTELLDLNLEAARTRAMNLPLMDGIASIGMVAILLYGGQLVIGQQLTIGALVAFTSYVSQLLAPIRRLCMIVAAIAQAVASGERVFEILDAESEVQDEPGAYNLERVEGYVRFERVSFGYAGRDHVLEHVSIDAHPGQVVALLGSTGSGKSTIVNLIPRFYDPSEGRITLDGHDIRKIRLRSLRVHIGVVLQDTTLFATSIRENIAFGRPDASEDEIIAAAKAAAAHEFIMGFPEQYQTRVGERGSSLSGGQRQRIAIARALLKDPKILILDDATSSVDTETEAVIQVALARLMQGRTSFVIAHRLSTVRRADLVLILEDGRIVARGERTAEHTAHEELLQKSALYAEVFQRQLRPDDNHTSKPSVVRKQPVYEH